MLANEERADRGKEMLEIYAHEFGDPYDPSANLTDLLTDLMHTAVVQSDLGLEFNTSLRIANVHFEAETEEQLNT
jgi:hypothetical protein